MKVWILQIIGSEKSDFLFFFFFSVAPKVYRCYQKMQEILKIFSIYDLT